MRLIIKITTYLSLCSLILPYCLWAEESPKDILELYISSNDKSAYKLITENQDVYRNLILIKLEEIAEGKLQSESLIYLATLIKDKRFIKPLVGILKSQYSDEYSCIYNCPIVLSLVVYDVYTPFKIPINSLGDSTAADDIRLTIKLLINNQLISEKVSNKIKFDDQQKAKLLKSIEELPYSEVINIALLGLTETTFWKYKSATWVLEWMTATDKHLSELYWLAITAPSDASDSYRESFYWAIYRAEQNRKSKTSHNKRLYSDASR